MSEPNIVGTRENRPEHSSTSRLAADRANSGHVTRLVHHRGRRDSEDRPRYSPGPPVGKEEAVTVGGPDPPSPRQGRARPSPSSGVRVSPDQLRRKGEAHVSQEFPPMGACAARSSRPRIGFPARA